MIKTSTNYDIVKYIYDELEEKKIEKFKFKINYIICIVVICYITS